MQLLQIFIPIFDNAGQRFSQSNFDGVRRQLVERFGGMTAFVQSPALGLWKDAHRGETARDDVILIEVMVDAMDREWWSAYRTELEQLFRQDEILVRAIACERV